jgi:hypothetical protein
MDRGNRLLGPDLAATQAERIRAINVAAASTPIAAAGATTISEGGAQDFRGSDRTVAGQR